MYKTIVVVSVRMPPLLLSLRISFWGWNKTRMSVKALEPIKALLQPLLQGLRGARTLLLCMCDLQSTFTRTVCFIVRHTPVNYCRGVALLFHTWENKAEDGEVLGLQSQVAGGCLNPTLLLFPAQPPAKGSETLRGWCPPSESLREWAQERWEPDSSRISTVIYVCLNSRQLSCLLKRQGWGRESSMRCSEQSDSEMISQHWSQRPRLVSWAGGGSTPPSLWSRGGVPHYHSQEMKDDKSSCRFLFL